jgi:arabinofuranan 3-O-arabinosyltransferase
MELPGAFGVASPARSQRRSLLDEDLVRAIGRCWIVVALLVCCFDFPRQLADGYTNGAGRPFGDDYVNYWSAAHLAVHDRARVIYDWAAFHAFQQSVVGPQLQNYHYSYPPVLFLLTAPLGLLPYLWGFFAWTIGSWFAFYRALAMASGRNVLMLALAAPAVFVNLVSGQNGTWTAALLGGGLAMIDRKPRVAGIMFGLMIYKPQFGLLLPIALTAGRRWTTLVSAALTVIALVGLSIVIYGTHVWEAYLFNLPQLRAVILEDGTGVWHRMLSIFVAARRLGADVPLAYLIQGAFAAVAIAAVAWSWWRASCPPALRNALFVLGTCLATPYLQDYDLVVTMFVAVWLCDLFKNHPAETACKAAVAALLIGPLAAAPLGIGTGLAFGPLFVLPAFALAATQLVPTWDQRVRAGLTPRPAGC